MTGPGRGEPDAFGASGEQAPPQPAVPRVLRLAWWVWIAATAVGFVRSVIQLTDRRMLLSRISEAAPDLSQSELDAAVNSGILLTLLLSLAVAAVYVLVANRMLRGRNWARVVTSLMAAFGVLGTFLALFGVVTLGSTVTVQSTTVRLGVLDIVFGVAVGALEVAFLVLVWHPDAIRFFRAAAALPKRTRTAGRQAR